MSAFCCARRSILRFKDIERLKGAWTAVALEAKRNQLATRGMPLSAFGYNRPFMAPQLEWPQTMMSVTESAVRAYSSEADAPPSNAP